MVYTMRMLEAEEITGLTEPELALSPDDLERDIFPAELSALESAEVVVLVLGKFVLVSCVFSFGSDFVAQHIQGRRLCVSPPEPPPRPPGTDARTPGDGGAYNAPYDWARTLRYIGTGTVFVGASQFIRLGFISRMFDPKDASLATVLHKTALNQLLLSPLINAGAMLTLSYTQNLDCEYAWAKLKKDFCEAQMTSYAVKPLGNFFAFLLFPGNITGQLVITRSVAFVYNIYFSVLTHRDIDGEHVVEWVKEKGWKDGEEAGDDTWFWHTETREARWTDPRNDVEEEEEELADGSGADADGKRSSRPGSRATPFEGPGSPRPHELRVQRGACGCCQGCAVM